MRLTWRGCCHSSLGIGVGVSSGANFLGGVIAQNRLGSETTVVTVFADDNKKYLSTDYSRPQAVQEGDLTPEIELLDVVARRLKSAENLLRAFFN